MVIIVIAQNIKATNFAAPTQREFVVFDLWIKKTHKLIVYQKMLLLNISLKFIAFL